MRFAISALALSSFLLAGCVLPHPTDSHLTARDWAPIGEKRAANPPGVWCYETIGKADCYTERLPAQDYRLIEGGPTAKPQDMRLTPWLAPPEIANQPDTKMAPIPSGTAKAQDTQEQSLLSTWFGL